MKFIEIIISSWFIEMLNGKIYLITIATTFVVITSFEVFVISMVNIISIVDDVDVDSVILYLFFINF